MTSENPFVKKGKSVFGEKEKPVPQRKESIYSKESPLEVVKRYQAALLFNPEDLRGKSILDVGAWNGKFAQGLRDSNITDAVVSVDKNVPEDGATPDVSFVVAKAQELPFPDGSFDFVFSVSAIPHTAHGGLVSEGISGKEYEKQSAELIAQAVRECLRVAKVGGEIRLGGLPKELKEYVKEGLLAGLKGRGEIVTSPESKKRGLYILRKLS